MATQFVILIVDDERTSADLLGMVLEIHFPEASICVAYGGQAGLDLATRQRPNVAILDLEMPGMDGEKLAHAVRTTFPDAAPLMIALSGNVARLAATRGTGAFDQHFSKPVDVNSLVRSLNQVVAPSSGGPVD